MNRLRGGIVSDISFVLFLPDSEFLLVNREMLVFLDSEMLV